jgi:transcriptional regulator with XRE-family HTH domain
VPRGSDERPSRLFKESKRFRVEAKQLGDRVRQLRHAKDWTLEEAAERMHLDLKHLQKVESGDPPLNVTLVTLVRIAEGLGEPLLTLFTSNTAKRSRPRR